MIDELMCGAVVGCDPRAAAEVATPARCLEVVGGEEQVRVRRARQAMVNGVRVPGATRPADPALVSVAAEDGAPDSLPGRGRVAAVAHLSSVRRALSRGRAKSRGRNGCPRRNFARSHPAVRLALGRGRTYVDGHCDAGGASECTVTRGVAFPSRERRSKWRLPHRHRGMSSSFTAASRTALGGGASTTC